MKKTLMLLCLTCLLAIPCLTACGSTKAKIYGIHAGIGLTESNDLFGNALADETTLAENDYILQYGRAYCFSVAYTAGGGSQYPLISADKIKLRYDDDALAIEQITESIGDVISYRLILNKSVVNTAVIVEVDEYTCTVIVSADR